MSVILRQGKQLLNPFVRIGHAYNNAAKKNPSVVGIVTTVLKTSAADAFAQLVVEGKNEIDIKRNSMFSMFGFAYLGVWQYQLYAKLFPAWTPFIAASFGKRMIAPILTFIDQAIHHPVLYFPAFYLLRGAMEGRTASSSLSKCRKDMWDNVKHLWTIWVPAQLINFSLVPIHLRVPFVAAVSFLWCVVLSALRGALEHAHDASPSNGGGGAGGADPGGRSCDHRSNSNGCSVNSDGGWVDVSRSVDAKN